MPSLETDIVGRVRRMGLKPSSGTALLPMFEAVSNGLHAIDDRHGQKSKIAGKVTVEVLRSDPSKVNSAVTGFVVTDNGIGLNEENYKSFLKPDSQHKLTRGGKGIGRLGWLRIFSEIRVDSTYLDETNVISGRSFDFVLSDKEQVIPRSKVAPSTILGTRVSLKNFDGAYGSKCPVEAATIKQRLIGHFITVLAANAAPAIEIVDGSEQIDLRDVFNEMIRDTKEEEVKIIFDGGEEINLTIRHIRASKAIRSDVNRKAWNWLYLTAHERTVDAQPIDDAIGLKGLDDGEVYVGCVRGPHLDDHVNQERTQFIFDGDENREIRRALLGSISSYLGSYVARIKEKKRQTVKSIISQYPQFHYINSDMEGFVENLAAGSVAREQIYAAMCINRFRKTNDSSKIKDQIEKSPKITQEVQSLTETYRKFVQDQQKGLLAEYVLQRKSVLDILDKYIGFRDGTETSYLEEAVHNLVVPMRSSSAEMEITDHNLWLIDDRLSFYSHFASDLKFRAYTDNPSLDRPDVAFFYDNCFAWQERDAGNTVVLVEFKRPGRPNYNGDDNPLSQVIEYIERFKLSNLRDVKGRVVSARLKDAAFHCYIVADLTPKLLATFRGHAFHPTPDGDGLIGFIRNPDAFVEVVSYQKMLRDAQMRNSVFFQKLGITDVDPSKSLEEPDALISEEEETF